MKVTSISGDNVTLQDSSYKVIKPITAGSNTFVKLSKDNIETLWKLNKPIISWNRLRQSPKPASGPALYNGAPKVEGKILSCRAFESD